MSEVIEIDRPFTMPKYLETRSYYRGATDKSRCLATLHLNDNAVVGGE